MIKHYRLTPVEQELMEILWNLGEGSVHDVIEKLSSHRKLAYTSVSTILRILQQKKIVKIKKSGRAHLYQPVLPKKTFAEHSLKKMVSHIFDGDPVELVSHLLDKNSITLKELKSIQQLINNKKRGLT